MSGVRTTVRCACGEDVEVDACPSCDALEDDCDACGGLGVVGDVLCAGCDHADRMVATRDWVG